MSSIAIFTIVGLYGIPVYAAFKAVQWGVRALGGIGKVPDQIDIRENKGNKSHLHGGQPNHYGINVRTESGQERETIAEQQKILVRFEADQDRAAAEDRRKALQEELRVLDIQARITALEGYDFSELRGKNTWIDVQTAQNRLGELKTRKGDSKEVLAALKSLEDEYNKLAEQNRASRAREKEVQAIRSAAVVYMDSLKSVDSNEWVQITRHQDILDSGDLQRMRAYLKDIRCSLATCLDARNTTDYYRKRIQQMLLAEDPGPTLTRDAESLINEKRIGHDSYQAFRDRLQSALIKKWTEEAVYLTVQNAVQTAGCTLVDEYTNAYRSPTETVYYDTDLGPEYKIAQVYSQGQLVLQLTRFMPREMDIDEFKASIGAYELQKDEDIARQWCSKLNGIISDLSSKNPGEEFIRVEQRTDPEVGESHIMYAYDERYAPLVRPKEKKLQGHEPEERKQSRGE